MALRSLKNAVVAITGASSGAGRATALTMARRGARLALTARGARALQAVARECERLGGQAIVVPADVTDALAVRRVADTAAEAFGALDVWVNNAGVGAVGSFLATPIEAHRRVIDTNLTGYFNGAHAALPHFMGRQGGVLVNVVSLGAYFPAPYAAAYSASKMGLLAFSESLRNELRDWPEIHVCDVFPSFLDTPGVRHGANYTGRALKPAPPVYDPQRVAEAVADLALRPRRRVMIGLGAVGARAAHALVPGLSGWVMTRATQLYLAQADPSPVTDGNLFRPMEEDAAIHGGWRRPRGRLLAAGVAAGGLVAAGLALAWPRPAR